MNAREHSLHLAHTEAKSVGYPLLFSQAAKENGWMAKGMGNDWRTGNGDYNRLLKKGNDLASRASKWPFLGLFSCPLFFLSGCLPFQRLIEVLCSQEEIYRAHARSFFWNSEWMRSAFDRWMKFEWKARKSHCHCNDLVSNSTFIHAHCRVKHGTMYWKVFA